MASIEGPPVRRARQYGLSGDVDKLFDGLVAGLGGAPLDILLVNNAGIIDPTPYEYVTPVRGSNAINRCTPRTRNYFAAPGTGRPLSAPTAGPCSSPTTRSSGLNSCDGPRRPTAEPPAVQIRGAAATDQ